MISFQQFCSDVAGMLTESPIPNGGQIIELYSVVARLARNTNTGVTVALGVLVAPHAENLRGNPFVDAWLRNSEKVYHRYVNSMSGGPPLSPSDVADIKSTRLPWSGDMLSKLLSAGVQLNQMRLDTPVHRRKAAQLIVDIASWIQAHPKDVMGDA